MSTGVKIALIGCGLLVVVAIVVFGVLVVILRRNI